MSQNLEQTYMITTNIQRLGYWLIRGNDTTHPNRNNFLFNINNLKDRCISSYMTICNKYCFRGY